MVLLFWSYDVLVKILSNSSQMVGDTTHATIFVNKLKKPMRIPSLRKKLMIVQIIPRGTNNKPKVNIPKIPKTVPNIPNINKASFILS
jgi:hypothetical protein